jgi:hypothetical protein
MNEAALVKKTTKNLILVITFMAENVGIVTRWMINKKENLC